MRPFIKLVTALVLVLGMSSVGLAEKGGKGKGAGGARGDHVSDMGMEKGKAYAGEKEEEDKKDDGDDSRGGGEG